MTELNHEQLADLTQVLARRRANLATEIHDELIDSGDERYVELASSVCDAGEEAIAAMFADVNISLINRHVREMDMIDRALRHIERGDYGVCIDCGDDIAVERLRDTPTAERCVRCQARYEGACVHEETPRL